MMRPMNSAPDRVIHVSLSEADWRAFLDSHPDPVQWLKDRIQEAIAAAALATRGVSDRPDAS